MRLRQLWYLVSVSMLIFAFLANSKAQISSLGRRLHSAFQDGSVQVRGCTRNLLVNGDFQQDWPNGWKRVYGDIEKGGSITEVIAGSNNRILHMKHTGL